MSFHSAPSTFISQVTLTVSDLRRSLTFYEKMIGFRILQQTETKAILSADGVNPLLILEQPEQVKPKQSRTTGLYHFALLLPKRSDLASVLKHLVENRYPLQGASDHLVSEAIYFADPDGNGIEMYRDRPASCWTWQQDEVMMDTMPLDLENLLAEANEDSWIRLPSNTVIGHIHLHVSDLEASEQFYSKLGFQVVTRYGQQALFISTGRYHHHIGLNTWAGVGAPAPSKESVGLKIFSLQYPHNEARAHVIEQLVEMGVPILEDGGQCIVEDPSHNVIQLTT
ncbi:VOC family protein [Halalkalibacter urbisdiaboli]|uniref:VOC family protein n=1 Tax=Halalkalibacter urbisdiaboli TaxID=1960589 RepID=UPI000B43C9A1|nr:VOC family protein [Halalkalibacter urbisdiaboli]